MEKNEITFRCKNKTKNERSTKFIGEERLIDVVKRAFGSNRINTLEKDF
jgi:hypothetical protein